MHRKQRLLRIFSGLVFLVFLTGVLRCCWNNAPAPGGKAHYRKGMGRKAGMEWGTKYWPTKPVRGGIYNMAGPLYIGLMNPNHWPVNDWLAINLMYEKLIITDGNYRPTVPWLAESWKYLNEVTVIMKLRQGVLFHDGSPFNAESLKYQMEWIMDAKNGAWSRSWLEPVASIEVVDPYTVKWNFKRPWAGFLGIMANVPGYAISAKALKADVALRESKQLAGQVEREKKNVADAEKETTAAVVKRLKKPRPSWKRPGKNWLLWKRNIKRRLRWLQGRRNWTTMG